VNTNTPPDLPAALAPVHDAKYATRDPAGFEQIVDATALCLSGGGYRAMLFHLGALLRLNQLGYLPQLRRVSSVSGGSIAAGVLATAWAKLDFNAAGVAVNFDELVVSPLRSFGGRTIDFSAIVRGLFLPGSASDRIAASYKQHLFGDRTLQDLPEEPAPSFVFNATSLQSSVLFRFSKAYLWDYRVGEVEHPTTPLAIAVAASSAFPPFLSPVTIKFPSGAFKPGSGEDLQHPPYTERVLVSDGGVYDNLGLETAWKGFRTILVSDGGGHIGEEARPARDWARQFYRVYSVTDNQVRSLRKQQVIGGLSSGARDGTFWGIRSHVKDFELPDALDCPEDQTRVLAETKTRLKKMTPVLQERLINWGYAICDTAMRKHVVSGATPPTFPYPGGVASPG
jgi:NTE family protein